MAAGEAGRCLPYADVADVEAAADSLGVLEPLRHLDKPGWLQASSVLEIDEGSVRPLAKALIELTHPSEQRVCLPRHVTLVMDDQAGHAAREAVSELRNQSAARPVQHIDATVQVNHRQVRMRGHKLQKMP